MARNAKSCNYIRFPKCVFPNYEKGMLDDYIHTKIAKEIFGNRGKFLSNQAATT